MTDMTADDQTPNGKKLKGWHVLLIMLGFFGVIFSVNGVFLYHAITSFPGEDVKKSYVQGLNYNDTLAARAAQAELGWSAAIGVDGETLVLQLDDRDGQPITNRVAVADLRRRASDAADHTFILQANTRGEYTTEVGMIEKGQWFVRVNVMDYDGETVQFTADKTFIVK